MDVQNAGPHTSCSHCFPCGANGRGAGGLTITWLTKFLGWMGNQIFLAMGLRYIIVSRQSIGPTRDPGLVMATWLVRNILPRLIRITVTCTSQALSQDLRSC